MTNKTTVNTQVPPTWTDRDSCFRCRTSFSPFTRKHHCRACGETFCSTCSSKSIPLPEFGIEDDVRVCESCYERITTKDNVKSSSKTKSKEKSQTELDEEDAFQLAIKLSQSEAEEKERQKKLLTQQYAMSNIQYPPTPIGSAPIADQNNAEQKTVGDESVKYLERNQWEKQISKDPLDKFVHDDEIEKFINSTNEHLNNIKFRMLSNQQRGRNIANDTAVQSVFIMLQHLYPELQRLIKSLDDKQVYYESLQDKLGQLKDAREALNALRDEHLENKKRQEFERDRQRQIQLAAKLDDMRQKKQAYLEYQRQLHLQHLIEQEREMKARLEQQRLYTQQREQQNQIDYRFNQISIIQPTVNIDYYQQQPSQLTSYSIPMGHVLTKPVVPVLSQIQQPYAIHPTIQTNDQTLISFD